MNKKTIKLAEKLLVASHGSEWAKKLSCSSLAVCAIQQAEAFFEAIANQETKAKAKGTTQNQ